MRIDGGKIAEEIKVDLRLKIDDLRLKSIVPKIAIITLGPEISWEAYVRQKIKVAGELGIKAVLINLSAKGETSPKGGEDVDEEKLIQTVREIDSDPNYHGIIVQRPIPANFDRERVVNSISPEKDVDGFRSDSKFEVPVWLAVRKLLEEVLSTHVPHPYLSLRERGNMAEEKQWNKLRFTVIGKGETAGDPVIRGLREMGIELKVIDSKTKNPDEILKNADIIISCVGKQNVIRSDQLKKGVILIGVGTHGEDTGLKGDYSEQEIEKVATAYTPTPGGVGPVNLSYLFKNLVEAAQNTSS